MRFKTIRFGSAILLSVLFIAACARYVKNPEEDYYSSTIVVWDSHLNEYHKLIYHTVYLENSTISGFSLNTLQVETFLVDDETKAKFETMKNISGVHTKEVKCVNCHPAVQRPKD